MPGLGRGWKRIWALLVAGCLSLLPGMREGAAQDPDDTAWQAARTAGSVEAFQEYLDQFPDGRHSDAAFAGIVVEAVQIGLPSVTTILRMKENPRCGSSRV
jgi:hypothetical protein